MYDYYLGGRTNFQADREAVSRAIAAFPHAMSAARANRAFMDRSTRYLAARGLRQFLDIGTGIPTSPNLHEIAQAVTPAARVVYVDNDPIVLAHAQALLRGRPQGRTAYVQADVNDPGAILADPVLHETLDLDQPVALSVNAVLHFIPQDQRAYQILAALKDALTLGSALVLSHGTADFAGEQITRMQQAYHAAGIALKARTRAQVAAFFDGWELVEPGVTVTSRWRPQDEARYRIGDAEASCYAGLAVKIEHRTGAGR
jgi:hypothetical protein